MRAVQRQVHVVVDAAQPLDREHLTADGQLPSQHPELPPLGRDRRVDLDGPLVDRRQRLVRLGGEDQRRSIVDDAGLGPGDVGDRVAQPFGVVQPDRCDHRDPGVQHVGRVLGAAQPDLDDRRVDRCVGERRDEGLEIGSVAIRALALAEHRPRLGQHAAQPGQERVAIALDQMAHDDSVAFDIQVHVVEAHFLIHDIDELAEIRVTDVWMTAEPDAQHRSQRLLLLPVHGT